MCSFQQQKLNTSYCYVGTICVSINTSVTHMWHAFNSHYLQVAATERASLVEFTTGVYIPTQSVVVVLVQH